MTLRVPIMVGDQQIGLIAIGRTAQRHADIDLYHYRWEVDIDGGPAPTHLKGGLDHNYSDGALELIRKVLDAATLKGD